MKHKIPILFVFVYFVAVCLARDSSKILKDVCKSDPKLKKFYWVGKEYEEIDEDAFNDCNELTEIFLSFNHWQKIPKKTFKNKRLSKLRELWISGGNIPIMDLDLTEQLTTFWIDNLNITIFPSKTFEGLTNLTTLSIYSNQLFDFDIERTLQLTPNLKHIYLRDNNFKCSRLTEIISYLKNKKVNVHTLVNDLRHRNYTPQTIEGIECLNDEQWQDELESNGLESYSLECLRGHPDCKLNEQVSESISHYTNKLVETVFNETQIELKEFDDSDTPQTLVTLTNNHVAQEDFNRLEKKIDNINEKLETMEGEKLENIDKKLENQITNLIISKIEEKFDELNHKIEEKSENYSKELENQIFKLNEKLKAMESEIFDQSYQTFGIFRSVPNAKLKALDQKITAMQETMKEIVNQSKTVKTNNDSDEDYS